MFVDKHERPLERPLSVNKLYEESKARYYGQTKYDIPQFPLPPKSVSDIHSILIADYEKHHTYNASSLLNLIEHRFKLLGIDMHHDLLEHCILYASNLLPTMKNHYADVMRVMFSLAPSQDENLPESEVIEIYAVEALNFYIGIDIKQTFGIGNRWPLFQDTVVPEIRKNLKAIDETYVSGFRPLNSPEEQKDENFQNLQYCFSLNIECVTKTLLTNPVFTAQYLLEKESLMDDKMLVLSSCEYLLKEIPVFANLKNGIPPAITDKLIDNLTNLVTKYNSLKENQEAISTTVRVSENQAGLFYFEEKSENTDLTSSLSNTKK